MNINIITAIMNLLKNPIIELNKSYVISKNRANSTGEALEEYVKDLFAGTINSKDEVKRLKELSNTFSYLGNQNNPPDAILKFGDAIEVKKIESQNSSLSLNSSYPKSKLLSNSRLISEACRICEPIEAYGMSELDKTNVEYWKEKDIIYIVGVVRENKLNSLAFVYGMDYAADYKTYETIKSTIKQGVESISNVEFFETNELGRVNKVDPLGITYLRVRGMWGIENPFRVFNYVYERDFSKEFNFMAIINKKKWETFKNRNELVDLISKTNNAEMKEVSIKDPNNPALLKDAVLIKFTI